MTNTFLVCMQWDSFISASNPGFQTPKQKNSRNQLTQETETIVKAWKYRRAEEDHYGNPFFVAAVGATFLSILITQFGLASRMPKVSIQQVALISMKVCRIQCT